MDEGEEAGIDDSNPFLSAGGLGTLDIASIKYVECSK